MDDGKDGNGNGYYMYYEGISSNYDPIKIIRVALNYHWDWEFGFSYRSIKIFSFQKWAHKNIKKAFNFNDFYYENFEKNFDWNFHPYNLKNLTIIHWKIFEVQSNIFLSSLGRFNVVRLELIRPIIR